MLIGVSNDNEILGLQEDLKTRSLKDLDEYENTLIQRISGRIGKSVSASCVRISFEELDGSHICRINVKPSTTPVFYREKGKPEIFFIRINNGTQRLSSPVVDHSRHRLKLGSNRKPINPNHAHCDGGVYEALKAIDLFAGPGGLSLGLTLVGSSGRGRRVGQQAGGPTAQHRRPRPHRGHQGPASPRDGEEAQRLGKISSRREIDLSPEDLCPGFSLMVGRR